MLMAVGAGRATVARLLRLTPAMKCDLCDNEATVHEVTVRNHVRVDRHLCEACAAASGLVLNSGTPLSELLSKFIIPATPPASPSPAGTPRTVVCGACQTTFGQFKELGLLGCPACYKAFEAQLSPLLERAHEGGVQHIGKVPRRIAALAAGESSKAQALSELQERAQRLRALRKQLEQAVKNEQYEQAARLRDELRQFGPGEQEGNR